MLVAIQEESLANAATMREWSADAQIAIPKWLTDVTEEQPSPTNEIELWRVRKNERETARVHIGPGRIEEHGEGCAVMCRLSIPLLCPLRTKAARSVTLFRDIAMPFEPTTVTTNSELSHQDKVLQRIMRPGSV